MAIFNSYVSFPEGIPKPSQTINFWVQGIAPATFEGPNISRNDAASVASRNRGLFVGHKSDRVSETLAQKERQIRLVATSYRDEPGTCSILKLETKSYNGILPQTGLVNVGKWGAIGLEAIRWMTRTNPSTW